MPTEQKYQLDIPLALPGVDDANDGCVARLQELLREQRGVTMAHIDEENGKPVLCLHYDPNLMTLEKLERLTRDEGAAITQKFKHETLPIAGMDCASCAASIEHIVRKVSGVLNVNVNYPTGKMKVQYDSTQTSRDAIIKAVGKLGYRVPSDKSVALPTRSSTRSSESHDHSGHRHQDGEKHDDESEDGHDHAPIDPNAPWLVRNRDIAVSLLAAVFLALGWATESFTTFPFFVAIAFYAASYVLGGHKIAKHGVLGALHGRFDLDFLMVIAAIGAAYLGDWKEGAFLLTLFSFSHALEHSAMERARDAIGALGKLTPKVARVRRDNQEIEVAIEALQIGDVAIVRPGDRVAVEGTIVKGSSTLDQSPITGESVPVEKTVGETVFAGSINGDGALEVEVKKLAQDTTMARVMEMVEEAQSQKSPTQTFAEKFERVFVPTVLIVVVLAAVVPSLMGWLDWRTALLRAISTLVAASPCALALATPAAVLAGIAQAARNGVLIKGGVHLENLGGLRAIALEKTGTLTRGRPEVADIVAVEGTSETDLLRLAASVETRSNHPLAQAVVRRAQADKLELLTAGELKNLQGRGVECEVDGALIRIGNARMFEESQIAVPQTLAERVRVLGESGKPTMIVARDQEVLGAIALADPLREQTPHAMKALRAMGIEHLVMLTGDNARVANTIAQHANVTDVRADLLPEHKVAAIKELMERYGAVAMVGDGVNDAPALANSTVGIAMGAGGTDVALETADVALMSDDVSKLPFAVGLSRQARAIIRQNLWISLGVIAILVPSTLFGFARLGVAVIFHEGSTLVVVANALRLLRYKSK